MRRLGKRGTLKAADKRAARLEFFRTFGVRENDTWRALCQSCGRELWLEASDFSHKIPAGRGGDVHGRVQAENGIASCRACHEWLERSPNARTAREALIASPVNTVTGGLVEWSPELKASLMRWLRTWPY